MAVRKTGSSVNNISSNNASSNRNASKSRKVDRLAKIRRTKNRRSLLETLEGRQLLAAGPTLVGVQPDSDDLLQIATGGTQTGTLLTSSPRELTFRFEETDMLDPETLGGIRIIRAGDDGRFDTAFAVTDLGSQGVARLQFEALTPGSAGNNLRIIFTKANRNDTTLPLVSVDADGRTIRMELNSNPARVTRASDIQFGINQNAQARELIRVASVAGQSFFDVGRTVVDNSTLNLKGSNVAQATSSLGAINVQVRFAATLGGAAGEQVGIDMRESFRVAGAPPIVSVIGTRVEVLINSNPAQRSTVGEVVTAINNNPAARQLLTAELEAGNPASVVGQNLSLITPINLSAQTGNQDIELTPGYVGLGNSPREVVFRFAEDLPQDLYRIEIDGSSPAALRDIGGEAFNDGLDQTILFELNTPPTIEAVVPQPIFNGQQFRDQVWVYFDRNDSLDVNSVRNPALYQLILTQGTETGADDRTATPISVSYNPGTGVAVLQFSNDLHSLFPGGDVKQYRLRVGNVDVRGTEPVALPAIVEPGDSFALARNIANDWTVSSNAISSVVIAGEIAKTEFINGFPVSNNEYLIDFPGGADAPGVQEYRPEDPFVYGRPVPDQVDGVSAFYYNFFEQYRGINPDNRPFDTTEEVYSNNITEQQKAIVRQVLDLYSQYLGIQFFETEDQGIQIAVGTLPNDLSDEGGFVLTFGDTVVIDQRDVDEADDDLFGGQFFQLASQAVLGAIGVDGFVSTSSSGTEQYFPTPREILEGQYSFRPDSTDIDLYRFEVPAEGRVTIETVAERLTGRPSMLDTHLRLYRELNNGRIEEVAANDDYWSEDSEITLDLQAGTYFVGVSASGNNGYDPMIEDSGIGGRSEGAYELRMSFRPNIGTTIVDNSPQRLELDGDNDGTPGGVFDFWFESAAFNETTFVKKGGGTVAAVVNNTPIGQVRTAVTSISTALASVNSLGTDIIRILPSGDGNLATTADNLPYLIGFDEAGRALPDGSTFQVPRDVTVMIDAGAIFKLRRARIGVGSSSPVVDHSGGSLQVLGTPLIVGPGGSQITTSAVSGEVIFTSSRDASIGGTQSGNIARDGDWGGIDYRSDIDKADESRINYEAEGIFLNVVQNADFRYGGGVVLVGSQPEVISPIELSETRATISDTRISFSADSGIEASADTFQDDKFTLVERQAAPDYVRVGPKVHDITFVDNSINGMFVRSETRDGTGLEKLTVQARFDDLDVVHVLSENLVLQGTPGGGIVETTAPPIRVVRGLPVAGGSLPAGDYAYRVSFVTGTGNESKFSDATQVVTTTATEASIRLEQLPTVPQDSTFSARRLYRSFNGGPFQFVATLNGSSTDFTDRGLIGGTSIESDRPNVLDVEATAVSDGDLIAGEYEYKISFLNSAGQEFLPSLATMAVLLPGDVGDEGSIRLERLPVSTSADVTTRRLYRSRNGEPFRLVAELDNVATEVVDTGFHAGLAFIEDLRARLDARLTIDPGIIVKATGAFIDVEQGAQLLAEGNERQQIVFTSLNDDRHGRGGTFKTNDAPPNVTFAPGDWAGIYIGPGAEASIDHSLVTGAGGAARVDGKLAFFNPIEVHQGDLRLANSRFESNGTGFATTDDSREGKGIHSPGVLFARGAQPVIVSNTFINNQSVAMSFDVNSMDSTYVSDRGTQIGSLDRFRTAPLGNQGPLIFDNVLESNETNGLEVRPGELAVAGVWDDADIVHVVRGEISVPNHEVFGSLRIESAPDRSLVVKFDGANAQAGLVAGGTLAGSAAEFSGANQRVGGALQIIGQPGKPVVLTSIGDDTIGAGFDTQGRPQTDTDNTVEEVVSPNVGLPTIGEVNNGLLIDNDVDPTVPGYFAVRPNAGGNINFGGGGGVTVQGNNTLLQNQNFIFAFTNFVDVGADGGAISLANTTITTQPTLIDEDLVVSEGNFAGANGLVNWRVETSLNDGEARVNNVLILSSDSALGAIRFINYLDEDVLGVSDDFLYPVGTPGQADFRVFTLDGNERIGFSQGGIYTPGPDLVGATYTGWAADQFNELQTAILGNGVAFTVPGTIDLQDLPPQNDPVLGAIFGPNDVTSAFAWDTDTAATSARITSFLELVIQDPTTSEPVPTGAWEGIVIREAANDRNVEVAVEGEGNLQINRNDSPKSAQFLGELAPSLNAGSENRRLGFQVYGVIDQPSDVDVFSFDAEAGTEVWLDIDRTTGSLDTVIELVRDLPSGNDDDNDNISDSIVAFSDGSIVEAISPDLIIRDINAGPEERTVGGGQANSLNNKLPQFSRTAQSAFGTPQDMFSVSGHDPGFRVVLPGETGEVFTYHVRVRSSNLRLGDSGAKLLSPETGRLIEEQRYDGLTAGPYELNIRLDSVDEVPGTYLHLADVRFASNGITVVGQPFNSPLIGGETEFVDELGNEINDTRDVAQDLGNLGPGWDPILTPNPNAADKFSIAGTISSATDIDWFQFTVNDISAVFDLDYADGLGRADLSLWIFDETGQLIFGGEDSNIADDQPGVPGAADFSSLDRGSAGTGDPFVGAVELAGPAVYYVAVSGRNTVPAVMDQFYSANATNPLVRFEPIGSVNRLIEDNVLNGTSTFLPSIDQRVLFSPQEAATPFTLNDVKIYVSTFNSFRLANAFTGQDYGLIGTSSEQFNDIAIRANGDMHGFDVIFNDDDSWHYWNIDTGDGTLTDLTPDGTGLMTQESDITVDANGNVTRVVAESDTGVEVNALTFFGSGGAERGFIVGDRGPGTEVDNTEDIVWEFDPAVGDNIGTIIGPGRAVGLPAPPVGFTGAYTSPRELGYIETDPLFPDSLSTRLGLTAATVTGRGGTLIPALTDGVQFTIRDFANPAATFRFALGSAIQINNNIPAGVFIRDGETIEVGGTLYEFDTGVRLQMTGADDPGLGGVAEGTRITLVDSANLQSQTFEFTSDANVLPGNIPVSLPASATDAGAAAALAAAINNADFDVNATSAATGEIVFSGLSSINSIRGLGIAAVGSRGVNNALDNPILIRIEEDFSSVELARAISTVFVDSGVATVHAGSRVDFTDDPTLGLVLDTPQGIGSAIAIVGTPNTNPDPLTIPFDVDDTAAEISARVVNAIEDAKAAGLLSDGLNAIPDGNTILVVGGNVLSAQNPLRVGQAPGGQVTGLAVVNGTMYAVSSQGGLYRIGPRDVNNNIGNYVNRATDLLGLQFTGLAAGPDNVSNGAYSDLLFGITVQGDIYAFNVSGELQPVFAGGASSISTGIFGATGFDFSNLDYNLWHVSQDTVVNNAPTPQILPGHSGTSSWYFGVDDNLQTGGTNPRADRSVRDNINGTYDFAGGAHGEIVSNPFSLEGYSPNDLPTFYFNYFLETDNNNSGFRAFEDALRVYIIDDNGIEHLLTTNNQYDTFDIGFSDDEFDDATLLGGLFGEQYSVIDPVTGQRVPDAIVAETHETFDNTDTWRQARVPLDDFAGNTNLRLRVEFSTAGSIEFGETRVQMVAGNELQDGQRFRINGRDFEIVMSPTLVLPDGSVLANGDSLTIDGVRYIFTNNPSSVVEPNIAVPFSSDDSASEIAATLRNLISDLELDRSPLDPFDNDAADTSQRNDTLETANEVALPGPNVVINTEGSIGPPDGSSSSIDVDMIRVELTAGQIVQFTVSEVASAAGLNPVLRLFDAEGLQLDRASVNVEGETILAFRADAAGTYFFGISGEGNEVYDPTSTLIGRNFGRSGRYLLNITATRPYDVRVAGDASDRVVLNGTGDITLANNSAVGLIGGDGVVGVPVFIDRDMTPTEVASAVADVIRQTLGAGQTIRQQGSTLGLPGLQVNNPGPFSFAVRSGDAFATPTVEMARDNQHRGVYLDDFIIGFRERGEQVIDAGINDTFVTPSPSLQRTNPPLPAQGIDSGEYQLEIRQATEFQSIFGVRNQFTSFDTNDRLTQGVTLEALDGAQLDAAANQLPTIGYADGDQITLTGNDDEEITYEIDRGMVISLSNDVLPEDAQLFSIFDGVNRQTFSFDSDGVPTPNSISISLINNNGQALSATQLSANVASAIEQSNLNLEVFDLGGAVQLFGSNPATSVTETLPSLTVSGGVGVNDIFALVVPDPVLITDGQTFTISRDDRFETFEFDFNNNLLNPGSIAILLEAGDTADAVARAISDAILLADLDLEPEVIANGRVILQTAPGVTINLSRTAVSSTNLPGTAIPIPLRGNLTDAEAAQQIIDALTVRNPDLQLTVLDGQIVVPLTFTLSDGQNSVTFEFVNASRGQQPIPGNVPISYDPGVVDPVSGRAVPDSAAVIARRIIEAIALPDVQDILNLSAISSSGSLPDDAEAIGDRRINLSGNVILTQVLPILTASVTAAVPRPVAVPPTVVNAEVFDHRGDSNNVANDSSLQQGVIKIDGVSVRFAEGFGIRLDHGSIADRLKFPKNLNELNTTADEAGLIPGVVVQSSLLAFNGLGGIDIQGIPTAPVAAIGGVVPRRAAIPFDRIVNNTIVGGSVEKVEVPPADEIGGTVFPLGSLSFADVIVSYNPSITSPPDPLLRTDTDALGLPDYSNPGEEPTPGVSTGAVSLGGGGSITVQFVDNRLVGSGDAGPDLQIFEVGVAEPVRVSVSVDGVNFIDVGTAVGGNNQIDVDRFGFGPNDPISFVRLTDLNFGSPLDLAVGADIDAIGAISSVPADQFTAGGVGIRLADGVSPTMINNVLVNNITGVDATLNPTLIKRGVLGANTYQINTTEVEDPNGSLFENIQSVTVDPFANMFISASDGIFIPAQGSQIVDSSIDSLLDRPHLATVRQSVGLLPSPILAPDYDANGALRIDDPTFEVPGGQGALVFKDRGAFDRGDLAPPVGIVITPLDNARTGTDIDPVTDSVQVLQVNKNFFEILLVDGGEPANPRGGVGIKDSSVTSEALVLFEDNVPLVAGEDYIFGYDASSDIIRLTPLAGQWKEDSVYQIRLLNGRQTVLRPLASSDYDDGDQFTIIDQSDRRRVFEIERGIIIGVPASSGQFGSVADGDTFTIFDGVNEVTFEFTNDQFTGLTNRPINIFPDANTGLPPSVAQISEAMVLAINAVGLNLRAIDLRGQVQILSDNALVRVDTTNSTLLAQGAIGVAPGFGIQVPQIDGVADGITDGQIFRIRRGDGRVRTFEVDTNNNIVNTQATPVRIVSTTNLDAIAIAVRDAIALSGLDLDPQLGEFGQVLLPNSADVTLELTGSVFTQIGDPGDEPATPIVLEGNLSVAETSDLIISAITNSQIPGVELTVINGIIVQGAGALLGRGATRVQPISDNAGNTLTSNDPLTGSTQFTIFLSAGSDYGDAPAPYQSLAPTETDPIGGPRHNVVPGFSLGATATPESNARVPDGDIDDGVALTPGTSISPSGIGSLDITLTDNEGLGGVLDAWIDWNQDGQFADNERLDWNRNGIISANERITLTAGESTYTFRVPGSALTGPTYGRFRLSSAGVSSPVGPAPDGEVEDILINVQRSAHQNPTNRLDVNNSNDVSPIDVLQVINAIGRFGTGTITSAIPTQPFVDVNGNGQLEPVDALIILNYLNDTIAAGEAEADQWVPTANGVLTPRFMDPQAMAAAGETVPTEAPKVISPAKRVEPTGSIFDAGYVASLDEVLDDLVEDREEEEASALDDFFANLSFE